jgi:hypothetical protein
MIIKIATLVHEALWLPVSPYTLFFICFCYHDVISHETLPTAEQIPENALEPP